MHAVTAPIPETPRGAARLVAVDIEEVARFLAMLGEDDPLHFRTFDDAGRGQGRNFVGTLDELATDLQLDNGKGRGVFVVVNEGGGKDSDIMRIRAVFADFDKAPLPLAFDLEPHMVVESSPGKHHAYWRCDDLPVAEFKPLQQRIATRYGSDPSVCNASRVMRVPGFIHRKPRDDEGHSGEPFRSRIIHESGALPYSADDIRAAFPPTARPALASSTAPTSGERVVTEDRHTDLLKLAAKLARQVHFEGLGHDAALALLFAEAGRGRWTRDMSSDEIRRALDGAIGKYRNGEWRQADVTGESQSRECRSAPEPLRRPTPPAEPYPLAELGDVLKPAAEAIRRVIQAPDAVIGGSLLAAASLAVQAQADVHIDGRTIPLSLWLLSVAESGERKSAVDGEAMQAARAYERELSKAYGEDCVRHASDLAEYEARRDAIRSDAKSKKGEGLADKLQGLSAAPPAPLLPRVTAADFTAEGLFKLLGAGRPSIGAFTDEAALVFGGHGMTKETVMRTAGTLCKLWDRGELDRVRSGDGASKLYGRRFALHLLAQPVIAERALSDDVLAGQGFLARCLLAWPEGTAGTRTYQAESLRDDPAMQRLSAVLLHRHRLALPLADGERQELAPRALRLGADAFAYWRTVHDTVEQQCGLGGRFAQVKPWASKTAEQALRIAGVLTLVETPDAQVIEAGTVERAAELALWHLNEALRLAGTAVLSPEVRDAEALLQWAHATGRRYLHSGEALRLGPARIRDRATFEQAIGELVRANSAYPVEGGMQLDGAHRRKVWRIVADGGVG
jgi:hypothetical protein